MSSGDPTALNVSEYCPITGKQNSGRELHDNRFLNELLVIHSHCTEYPRQDFPLSFVLNNKNVQSLGLPWLVLCLKKW